MSDNTNAYYAVNTSDLYERSYYKWLVLAVVMLGTFISVLDASIVNVAMPKMMAAFSVSVDKIEWVLTVYLLVRSVIFPSSGWIADHLGYKSTYNLGLILFTLPRLIALQPRRK